MHFNPTFAMTPDYAVRWPLSRSTASAPADVHDAKVMSPKAVAPLGESGDERGAPDLHPNRQRQPGLSLWR